MAIKLKSAAVLLSALLWVGAANVAVAQRITYEANGQTRTYDMSEREATSTAARSKGASRARRGKLRAVVLPRGSKDIPWDEPGKVSGVSGVQENAATDLHGRERKPAVLRAKGKLGRAEARKPEPETHSAASHVAPGASDTEPSAGARHDKGRQRIQAEPGPHGPPSPASAEVPRNKTATDAQRRLPENAEPPTPTHAKAIAEATAKAAAEEQRRVELEKRRDPRWRRSETREVTDGTALVPANQMDPETTGTVGAGKPASATALGNAASRLAKPSEAAASAAKPSLWQRGPCRMLFFGALPGC